MGESSRPSAAAVERAGTVSPDHRSQPEGRLQRQVELPGDEHQRQAHGEHAPARWPAAGRRRCCRRTGTTGLRHGADRRSRRRGPGRSPVPGVRKDLRSRRLSGGRGELPAVRRVGWPCSGAVRYSSWNFVLVLMVRVRWTFGAFHGRDEFVLGQRAAFDARLRRGPRPGPGRRTRVPRFVADEEDGQPFVAVVLDDLAGSSPSRRCRRPRSGASGRARPGCVPSAEPSRTFCWLPPLSSPTGWLNRGALRHRDRSASVSANRRRALRSIRALAWSASSKRGEGDVVLDGHSADQAGLDAVLGHQRDAGSYGRVRVPAGRLDRLALDLIAPFQSW